MIAKHKDGNITTPDVGQAVRGLKLSSITLDTLDISNLIRMDRAAMGDFLRTLHSCMHTPKPVYMFTPTDAHNEVLRAEGRDYMCFAVNQTPVSELELTDEQKLWQATNNTRKL